VSGSIWVDGRLVAEDQAAVSVLDHAFTVGDAVFETMKVVDSVPFALSRHLRRLAGSAAGLGLPAPDDTVVRAAVAAVLGDADPAHAHAGRLRITYGGGVGALGSGRAAVDPRLVVVLAAATPWEPTTAVVTVPWRRNERSAVAGIKTTSYAENVRALEFARERGASEALMANTQDVLCEGTGSNVFLVRDGAIITPSLASGCLAGITRELVLEWTDAVERPVTMGELAAADEVFLTSSTRDVHPVLVIDDRVIGSEPGRRTREVADVFTTRSAQNGDP
jgi:branched-chain amino acid aminotransferase